MALFGPPDIQKLKAKGDVKRLAKALTNEDPAIRRDAGQALAELGDANAIPEVLAALEGESEQEVIEDVLAPLRALGDRAVPALRAHLFHAPAEKRAAAGGALARLDGDQGLDPLVEALHDDDIGMRAVGAVSLGTLGSDRARDELVAALHSDEIDLRLAAMMPVATGQIKDDRVLVPLVDALGAGGPAMRTMAAKALGELGDRRAERPLLVAVEDDPDESVRAAAEDALDQLGV